MRPKRNKSDERQGNSIWKDLSAGCIYIGYHVTNLLYVILSSSNQYKITITILPCFYWLTKNIQNRFKYLQKHQMSPNQWSDHLVWQAFIRLIHLLIVPTWISQSHTHENTIEDNPNLSLSLSSHHLVLNELSRGKTARRNNVVAPVLL